MNADSPILTIAIPTYNRAAKLQAQLERLLPQSGPEIRLCVYDNASPDDTQAVVAKYISQGVSYYRAATNCGAGRNVFRCFEECQTEWLWVLSDDDLASETAAKDLLTILRQQSYDFIHLSTCVSAYGDNLVVSDVESLLQRTMFSALLWISAGVYRVPSFVPLYRMYNDSLSTWCPHLLMVLSLLESQGGKVLLSTTELLARTHHDACRWSTLDCILRNSQAPEYLMRPANQKLLATRILVEWFNETLLLGLREATQAEKIQRWQRIRRLSYMNLKAYAAQGSMNYFIHNWFRAGLRKRSLNLVVDTFMVDLLGWCSVCLFRSLMKLLPLPKTVKDECCKHEEYDHSS